MKEVVYCEFTYRRPKKKQGIGYFTATLYKDPECKKELTHKTREYKLWDSQQFITAIQSYEHALKCVYEWQGLLKKGDVGQVILVTDNGILAGWIENPNKNKSYSKYMEKAVADYRVGGKTNITLGIGLMVSENRLRANKYCDDKYVQNRGEWEREEKKKNVNSDIVTYRIPVKKFKTVHDIEQTKVDNIKELTYDDVFEN